VVIWGQRAGTLMRLIVLGGPPPSIPEIGRPTPWSVVALPLDVPEGAVHILHATILAAALPSPDDSVQDARDARIRKAVAAAEARLGPRTEALFAGEVPAGYRLALARLQAREAAHRHDADRLAAAKQSMEAALTRLAERWPSDLLTLARIEWADLHLETMPPFIPGPARDTRIEDRQREALREICDTYTLALDRLGPDRLPLDTALPRLRLAKALLRLAAMDGEPAYRAAALAALDTATQTLSGARHLGPARTLWTVIVTLRLKQAIAASDADAVATIAQQVKSVITHGTDEDDAPTLAHLYHTQATALAALAWYQPAPGLRDQAMASLEKAVALYRALNMGSDLHRARRLGARLLAARPALTAGRTQPHQPPSLTDDDHGAYPQHRVPHLHAAWRAQHEGGPQTAPTDDDVGPTEAPTEAPTAAPPPPPLKMIHSVPDPAIESPPTPARPVDARTGLPIGEGPDPGGSSKPRRPVGTRPGRRAPRVRPSDNRA